jgi:tRNA pseudouridine13 synthase
MTASASAILNDLPYLTRDVPPLHAAIKRRYEDFVVEEIPAYEPCGEGDHCYFTIEKRGLATMRAVNDIARELGILSRDIGLAGLKDARAVATQTLSIEHIDPQRLTDLNIPRIRVLGVSRHRNKLKIGHLRGNQFRIKLREVEPGRIGDIKVVCDSLSRRGVPNYFGQQRFGSRGDTWQLGRAVLHGEQKLLLDLMLGTPSAHDTGPVLRARKLYDAGNYEAAAKAWPYGFRDNVRACRALAKSRGKIARGFHAIDARLKKFFVSAYQSRLFNQVLAHRIDEIHTVRAGDLAYKHDNGAVFRVVDAQAEAPRAEAFEISPTGPIFGHRMTCCEGGVAEIENAVLAAENLTLESFHGLRSMKLHGSRRPLRFRPEEMNVSSDSDEAGEFVELTFTLPSGCYATMILREVCKDQLEERLEEIGEEASTASTESAVT